MHRGDGAVFLYASLHLHQNGMTSAMAIKNFFARERTFHGSARDHRESANNHFMIKRIALAAKAAAIWRSDDANMAGRKFQNFGQRAMYVVRRLGRVSQSELFVRVVISDGRVLLHRQMGVALVEESVFANQIGFRESRVRLAEF